MRGILRRSKLEDDTFRPPQQKNDGIYELTVPGEWAAVTSRWAI
jgi:hypothetical protein